MIVCIDIGGGTTRVGFSEDGRTFKSIVKFPTYQEFDEEINRIIQEIKNLSSNIEKISFAAAGTINRNDGRLIKWGQRHSWWGKSIFEPLRSSFPDAILKLENDAQAAGIGEAVFGSGQNHRVVGYITLSTGVGGGLYIDKNLAPHMFGFEPGHQIVNFAETETWSCGQKGCWEAYASGIAFKKRFGVLGEECEDQEIWNEYAKLLAPGISNTILIWSPEIIILGGGIAGKFDRFIEPLKAELIAELSIFEMPEIVKAKLDEPGLYGGLVI